MEGGTHNLIEKILADKDFHLTVEEINEILNPNLYIGRSVRQVEEFVQQIAEPVYSKLDTEIQCQLKI